MSSLTIRKLDIPLKTLLRVQAAKNGHSMEQEAREILRAALTGAAHESEHIVTRIMRRFGPDNGVELDLPSI